MEAHTMITEWVLKKLEAVKDAPVVLVRDGLRLLQENDGTLHRFAEANAFTVIMAATNLVFRELLEATLTPRYRGKLLLVDRAPLRRRQQTLSMKAPPPFYPDVLWRIAPTAVINVSLRQFLEEESEDPEWPAEADDPRFARLMAPALPGLLQAHKGLRAADSHRFTDQDFQRIVAYAVLGVPDRAFKKPDAQTCWRIAISSRSAWEALTSLAPDAAIAVKHHLRTAPPPFCHVADAPPELVVRAFWLAVVLSQHCEHWKLLLGQIDPTLQPFHEMDVQTLRESAPVLAKKDPATADADLRDVEENLSPEALHMLLLEQMALMDKGRFLPVLEAEHYSTLIRGLALVAALDDLVSERPTSKAHTRLQALLEDEGVCSPFVVQRPERKAWDTLVAVYTQIRDLLDICRSLDTALAYADVQPSATQSLRWFVKWKKLSDAFRQVLARCLG